MKIEGQGTAVNLTASVTNEGVRGNQDKPIKTPVSDGQKEGNAKPQAQKNEKDIENAAEVLNETMKIYNYHLEFKLHKASGKMQVKVVDSETKKVIREIPPEQILDCSARIRELLDHMAGILVDELV